MSAPERTRPHGHRYGDHGNGGGPPRRRADPPLRPQGSLRVSNDERQAVVDELTTHTADGRLTLDEFEERAAEAHAASTGDELGHALRELPPLPAGAETGRRHRARDRRFRPPARFAPAALVAGVLLGVAVSAGRPWLLVPALWLLLGPARLWGHRRHRPGW